MSLFRYVNNCRCCGNLAIDPYLDLGYQPLANSYHKNQALPAIPLQIRLCSACRHSQLSVVVNPGVMFKNYLYVSGTTKTFNQHCQALAADVVERKGPCSVLDIACNDGTLLAYFRSLGCAVLGMDPAENLRAISEVRGIPVVVDYWGSGSAAKLDRSFDVITATNVFAHVDNVAAFLDEAQRALRPDGLIVLEFPYCNNLIKLGAFDTIYHEHLSYFLVNSFRALTDQVGLGIVDVMLTPVHGGSVRFFVQSDKNHCPKVGELVEQERQDGLLNSLTYYEFADRMHNKKAEFRKLVRDLRATGHKLVGYGASAKGNTMLNFFKVQLDYIVDDNPLKWGYLTPGRDIPICDPQVLATEEPLHIVVLAWNFYDEVVNRVKAIAGHDKHRFVTYVPTVAVK